MAYEVNVAENLELLEVCPEGVFDRARSDPNKITESHKGQTFIFGSVEKPL